MNNEILIADASPIDAAHMRVMLERNGWQVQVVNDGSEVLKCLKGKSYALLIVNEKLKRISGEETIRQIRELEKMSNTPVSIIGTVGSTLANERNKLISAGANECVSKPIYQHNLLEVIRQVAFGKVSVSA